MARKKHRFPHISQSKSVNFGKNRPRRGRKIFEVENPFIFGKTKNTCLRTISKSALRREYGESSKQNTTTVDIHLQFHDELKQMRKILELISQL